MVANIFSRRVLVAACSVALAALGGVAVAAGTDNGMSNRSNTAQATAKSDKATDARRQMDEAAQVIRRMEQDGKAAKLLPQAAGVFIVPHYGRAALGVGGRGGEGVLMVRKGGTWGEPAFYNTGGVSIGAEAGVEGGSLVFVLNNDKAVRSFRQDNNWSLNAEAGLTIVAWSGKAQSSTGKGDVTVWSDTKGLLGSLAISVTDINFDDAETGAFYGRPMKVADVFSGSAQPPSSQIAVLQDALSAASGGAGSGAMSSTAAGTYAGSSAASGKSGSTSMSGTTNNANAESGRSSTGSMGRTSSGSQY